MKITDLNEVTLISLLKELQTSNDISVISEKYGFLIPQWITIKYRCVACFKETRSKIQSTNIRKANKQLTCPFCRKISRMFSIHTETNKIEIKNKDFIS